LGQLIYSDRLKGNGRKAVQAPVKRRYSDGGSILVFALILLAGYLGGYTYNLVNRDRIAETTVMFGSIEPVRVFEGVIVRNERVYYANTSGLVVYRKQNGDKVSAGSAAASVQDAAAVQRLWESIINLQGNILNQQESRNLSAAVSGEIRSITAQLTRSVDNMALEISTHDMQSLYTLTHRIEQLVYNRNNIYFNEAQGIPRLSAELGSQFEQMGRAVNEIRVRHSGIISYKTDGFEYRLTPANLRVLSREETLASPDYDEIFIPGIVNPGDPVFKTINTNEWFIAAYLPLDQVLDWQVNQNRLIYVDDGSGNFNELQTTVHFMDIIGNSGEAYVVLRVNRQVTDYMDQRGVRFKIKRGLTEGLKIPNSAIADKVIYKIPAECVMERGSLRQVLRYNRQTGGFEETAVIIFSSEPGFAHVIAEYNDIRVGDILAVPDTRGETRMVTQSEVIKGVYVTNTGVAVFRRIHLTDDGVGDVFGNINYTIIDPALNNGANSVRMQDRIASDASRVTENQFVN
jgi:hypothetical protein